MRGTALGAIGAFILTVAGTPALAGGYYDAGGYDGPPPCDRGCPPPCPTPAPPRWREGPADMGPPPAWNGPPPAAYDEGSYDGGVAPAQVYVGGEGYVDDGGAGIDVIDFAGRGRDFRGDHGRFFDGERFSQHQSASQQVHSYERQSASEHAYEHASEHVSVHVASHISRSSGGWHSGGGRRW